MKNKEYAEDELKLLEAMYEFSKGRKISRAKLAWTLVPLLDRTDKAIAQRLNRIAKDEEKQQEEQAEKEKENTLETAWRDTYSSLESEEPSSRDSHLRPEQFDTQYGAGKVTPKDLLGQTLEVIVYKVREFGAFCKTEHGLEGLLPLSHFSQNYVTDANAYLAEGDRIKVKVIPSHQGKDSLTFSAKLIGGLQPKNDVRTMVRDSLRI